jgi:predicted AAA+ superfamily ATPase
VIGAWSPIHLRTNLRELYWKDGTVAVRAASVWEDMQRYLYMPRLKRRSALEQAIVKGAASRDFFGTVEFPSGASEQTRRAVSENAGALGFKSKSWE